MASWFFFLSVAVPEVDPWISHDVRHVYGTGPAAAEESQVHRGRRLLALNVVVVVKHVIRCKSTLKGLFTYFTLGFHGTVYNSGIRFT